MARSCNFDRQEKLVMAMELFWQQGFAQTSIADLVTHLGINRFSLYNSFGDKLSLYRESLQFYLNHYSFPPLAKHLHQDAGITEITAYLQRFIALQQEQKYGCFLQNALLEKCLDDECVQQESEKLFAVLSRGFEKALYRSQQQGELRNDVNCADVSAFLVLQLQGIRVLGKAGQYGLLDQAQRVMLAYLDGLRLHEHRSVRK